ncbi:MAG: acetyltransferase [Sphingomonadales bacterium]|nr:MAG: acetyltransferase [Sphingomonadales bacterium]
MARIAIYGAGGLGRDLIGPIRRKGEPFDELVFVDQTPGGDLCGIPILSLDDLREGDHVVIAAGSGQDREAMERHILERKLIPYSFFAPFSCVGVGNDIAPGALFCDYSLIGAAAKVGRQFQCNVYSYVSHDCVIGDYVTFAPKVSCNGNVHIEDYAYIGTGAVLRQGSRDKPLVIGRGATVGMGAVVTRDVAPGVTVIGAPARPMER